MKNVSLEPAAERSCYLASCGSGSDPFQCPPWTSESTLQSPHPPAQISQPCLFTGMLLLADAEVLVRALASGCTLTLHPGSAHAHIWGTALHAGLACFTLSSPSGQGLISRCCTACQEEHRTGTCVCKGSGGPACSYCSQRGVPPSCRLPPAAVCRVRCRAGHGTMAVVGAVLGALWSSLHPCRRRGMTSVPLSTLLARVRCWPVSDP